MKKGLNIIKSIFTWLLVIAAVSMMIFTVVSVNTFNKTDRSLFGYKAFIVLSDSMSTVNGDASKGYFDAGDLVLIKEVDPVELRAGDIISYTSTNTENFGKTVTHMIRSLTQDEEGNHGFITYGTATNTDDAEMVKYNQVIGKYFARIPQLGTFFQFLKTPPGYIVCIFLPFVLLILIQGFNSIRLFKKYKAEQVAEIEAQREQERMELEAKREQERAELEAKLEQERLELEAKREQERLELEAKLEEERAAMAEERKNQEEMMQKILEMQTAMQSAPANANNKVSVQKSRPTVKKNVQSAKPKTVVKRSVQPVKQSTQKTQRNTRRK